jgi:hypothetical protein
MESRSLQKRLTNIEPAKYQSCVLNFLAIHHSVVESVHNILSPYWQRSSLIGRLREIFLANDGLIYFSAHVYKNSVPGYIPPLLFKYISFQLFKNLY